MMMQNTVKERLILFIETLGISTRAFEKGCGLSNGYIKALKSAPSVDKVRMILDRFPSLSYSWLMTGEGEMMQRVVPADLTPITGQETEKELDAIAGEAKMAREANKLASEANKFALVPLLPMSAIGGALCGVSASGVMSKDCELIPSPIKDVDFAITVYGDSMLPKYPSGTKLFIKEYHPDLFIEPGKAYVLDTENGVIVKEVTPIGDGMIRCHSTSDNPKYVDFDINLSDVRKMYRILLSMSPE
jgi:phage repressor protein C with HTH and peptisase S24 domain